MAATTKYKLIWVTAGTLIITLMVTNPTYEAFTRFKNHDDTIDQKILYTHRRWNLLVCSLYYYRTSIRTEVPERYIGITGRFIQF